MDRINNAQPELLTREAAIAPSSWNADTRTIEMVMSTGARGVRTSWFDGSYEEELSMDSGAVRLERLNNHAPFLVVHRGYSADAVIGKVVPGSARVEGGSLVGRVEFAADSLLDDEGRRTVGKIATGLLRNVSIGFNVRKWNKTDSTDRKDGGKLPLFRAVDWEPVEASIVPIGFDDSAKTRSLAGDAGITQTEEHRMNEQETAVTPVAAAEQVSAPKGVDEKMVREQERQRIISIRARGLALKLDEKDINAFIDDGSTVETAVCRMVDLHAEKHRTAYPVSGAQSIDPGVGSFEKARPGIVSAIAHRLGAVETEEVSANVHRSKGPLALDENARRFRGLGLTDIGRFILEERGVNVRMMNKHELTNAMLTRMGTVGDFPSILLDAAHKSLASQFMAAPREWLPLGKRSDASDFKTKHSISVGQTPDFNLIPEGSDYEQGMIEDYKESYALKTYGRAMALSRQALINDDLSAFSDLQARFLFSSLRKERALVMSIFIDNPDMADGTPLFHADHDNNSGTAAAPDATTVGAGYTAMNAQVQLGGTDALGIEPKYLLVPANYRANADQLVNATMVPITVATAVPTYFKSLIPIVGASLNAATWFMVCDPMAYPTFEYAYLSSASGLQTEQLDVSAMKGIEIGAWLDFAAKAIDWRGMYRNGGAVA